MKELAREIIPPLTQECFSPAEACSQPGTCLIQWGILLSGPQKENTTLCQVLCHPWSTREEHPVNQGLLLLCCTPKKHSSKPSKSMKGTLLWRPTGRMSTSRLSMIKTTETGEVTESPQSWTWGQRIESFTPTKKTLYKALILSVNSFSVKSMTLLSGHHSRYKRVKALAYWPKMDGKTSNSLVVCPPWEMKGHLQHPTSLWSRKLQSISDTLNSATRMLTIKKRR